MLLAVKTPEYEVLNYRIDIKVRASKHIDRRFNEF